MIVITRYGKPRDDVGDLWLGCLRFGSYFIARDLLLLGGLDLEDAHIQLAGTLFNISM